MTDTTEPPTVFVGGLTYRLPFAMEHEPLFRPWTPAERADVRESMLKISPKGRPQGIMGRIVTYDSPTWGLRCVIDGANRLRLLAELLNEFPDLTFPQLNPQDRGRLTDEHARDIATDLNLCRRHLTPAEQHEHRQRRITRVVLAHTAGQSLRAIAADQGVSLGQVQADLADSVPADVAELTPAHLDVSIQVPGVYPYTPEPKLEQPTTQGADGKTYRRVPQKAPVEVKPYTPADDVNAARATLSKLRAQLDVIATSPLAERYKALAETEGVVLALDAIDVVLEELR